jgi:hypothetical protein
VANHDVVVLGEEADRRGDVRVGEWRARDVEELAVVFVADDAEPRSEPLEDLAQAGDAGPVLCVGGRRGPECREVPQQERLDLAAGSGVAPSQASIVVKAEAPLRRQSPRGVTCTVGRAYIAYPSESVSASGHRAADQLHQLGARARTLLEPGAERGEQLVHVDAADGLPQRARAVDLANILAEMEGLFAGCRGHKHECPNQWGHVDLGRYTARARPVPPALASVRTSLRTLTTRRGEPYPMPWPIARTASPKPHPGDKAVYETGPRRDPWHFRRPRACERAGSHRP